MIVCENCGVKIFAISTNLLSITRKLCYSGLPSHYTHGVYTEAGAGGGLQLPRIRAFKFFQAIILKFGQTLFAVSMYSFSSL